ncbi:hypothetical protein BDV96DRAFT_121575 [Lophiotrema nucula]|uniref:Uncharacterized protein n=1 Tax=Lophiotrema nucula TaxID=690887 RepID=A0A6A5Z4T9_9PLEO|nr:hypothetical protein BDV96DRAFT_121575 [Lophiotrema nucula]
MDIGNSAASKSEIYPTRLDSEDVFRSRGPEKRSDQSNGPAKEDSVAQEVHSEPNYHLHQQLMMMLIEKFKRQNRKDYLDREKVPKDEEDMDIDRISKIFYVYLEFDKRLAILEGRDYLRGMPELPHLELHSKWDTAQVNFREHRAALGLPPRTSPPPDFTTVKLVLSYEQSHPKIGREDLDTMYRLFNSLTQFAGWARSSKRTALEKFNSPEYH